MSWSRNTFGAATAALVVALGLVWGLVGVRAVAAQEKPADAKPADAKPEEAKPADAKPADAKPEPAKPADAKPEAAKPAAPSAPETSIPKPPADPEAATKAYLDRYEEWKTILKDLRAIRIKYQTAKDGETAELQKQYDQLLDKGEQFLPVLREAAIVAYLGSPNVDLALSRFLVKMLADDIERDDYERARALAAVLIENGCEIKAIYDYAGVAAFATNDYEKAAEYLKIAADANALETKAGQQFRGILPTYVKFWEREAKLREEEAKSDLPRVKLETSKGTIVVELFENEAPETVGNFVSLVEKKFYDGLAFHRVLPGFMAQGGCPIGDGTGDPGYKIYCECYKEDHRKHFRGSLSMAKGAAKDTGGSQFFLTFVPTPHLNGQHTVFGRVIEGLDVLSKLQRHDPQKPGSVKPKLDKIITAEVIRKRDHKYEPNPVK